MSLFSRANQALYFHTVADLLAQPGVQRLRAIPHHRLVNRFDHVLLVSYVSFALARRWGWDARAAARAGLLHDLFWESCSNSFALCLNHPETAVRNAGQLTPLSDRERNIILSHMWPAARHLPRYRESWLVDMADNVVCALDYLGLSGRWTRRLAALAPV